MAEAMKKAGPLIPAFLGLARGAKALYNAAPRTIQSAAVLDADVATSAALGTRNAIQYYSDKLTEKSAMDKYRERNERHRMTRQMADSLKKERKTNRGPLKTIPAFPVNG